MKDMARSLCQMGKETNQFDVGEVDVTSRYNDCRALSRG